MRITTGPDTCGALHDVTKIANYALTDCPNVIKRRRTVRHNPSEIGLNERQTKHATPQVTTRPCRYELDEATTE